MVRLSKQEQRRSVSRRRPKLAGPKTGPKKDNLPKGFREHLNADSENRCFIPKTKTR